ncbi:hypothetical protein, partial [Pseudoxanthobacter sp.]|uniref:hypothetical protein n=1 Tax=Pseudoxanthobacter sp. TaxID=1925742 RepID=UPI002FE2A0C4
LAAAPPPGLGLDDLFRPFWRFIRIIVAYIAAVVAASTVLVAGLQAATGGLFGVPFAAAGDFGFWATVAIFTPFVGSFAFLPALGAIAVGEVFRLRSVFYWVGAGGAIGFLADISGLAPRLPGGPALEAGLKGPLVLAAGFVPPGLDQASAVLYAAGLAGGLTYWLLAGRG